MSRVAQVGARLHAANHEADLNPSLQLDSAASRRCTLRHWLQQQKAWEVLVKAGANTPRRVAVAAGELWPNRFPYGTRSGTRTYSWPEMQAIAAHLSGEVQ